MRNKLMLFLIVVAVFTSLWAVIERNVTVTSSDNFFYGSIQAVSEINTSTEQYIEVPSESHFVFISGGEIILQNEFVVDSGAEFEAMISIMFEDPELEACVREKLNLMPEDVLDPLALLTITELTCNGRGIESLSGIEFLPNLGALNVIGNRIRDLEPIKALAKLVVIDVSNNLLEKLLPDDSVPSLVLIAAHGNYISEILGFTMGNSGSYKTVDVSNNYITHEDISKGLNYNISFSSIGQKSKPTDDQLRAKLDFKMKVRLGRCFNNSPSQINTPSTNFTKCNIFSLPDAESCYSCIEGKCPFDDLEGNCPSCSEELYCKVKRVDFSETHCDWNDTTRFRQCEENIQLKQKQECVRISYNTWKWKPVGKCVQTCFDMPKGVHTRYVTPKNEMQIEKHTCDNNDSGDSIWHKESPKNYSSIWNEQSFPLQSDTRSVEWQKVDDVLYATDSLNNYKWHVGQTQTIKVWKEGRKEREITAPLRSNLADAKAYCSSLTTQRSSAWKVPTLHQLRSIVDYKKDDPAVSSELSGFVASTLYWSKTIGKGENLNWALSFRNGENILLKSDEKAYVICVEASNAKMSAGSSYSDPRYLIKIVEDGMVVNLPELKVQNNSSNASFTVEQESFAAVDRFSGLMWEGQEASSKSYSQGVAYCGKLDLLGFDDWKVPTAEELFSLINSTIYVSSWVGAGYSGTSYYAPGGSFTRFPGIKADSFWSSTQSVSSPESNWIVDFGTGKINYKNRSHNIKHVKCVRDYKSGERR